MLKKIIDFTLITFLIGFIFWILATGMLFIAENMYENNHKSVCLREDFEEYSSMRWIDEASPQWHNLEKIYIPLKNIGVPLECISFELWRMSALIVYILLLVKYTKEELEE